MKRFAQVIGIKPKHIEEYTRLHADVWPGVLAKIYECNMRNYSIFRYHDLLFAYFEYIGNDYEADMAKIAADETRQEWWAVCGQMQRPMEDRAEGECWKTIEEVFHTG